MERNRMTEQVPETRAGFVALMGPTNAGKSTLLNRLVGSKVAIVSHKVQTTRALVRGIAILDETQVVFVDTPGLFKPKRRLDRAMVDTAWSGAKDAECVCFVIDARKGLSEIVEAALEQLQGIRQPKWLVLNKIDEMDQSDLLPLIAAINEKLPFDETFPLSAITGEGVDVFIDALRKTMKPGPWLYPEDQISDMPMRMLAAELTREKLYERLHEELPYVSHVVTEDWKTTPKGHRVEQTIYVERDSQKKIVLGKGGQTIKWISTNARKAISHAVDAPVHLFLFVKVRPNWASDPERYNEMGLDFPTQ
ncbi:MAG: GTPase Era [Rhizobiales bacterium]|nr:GTPase Era [Hyphomicrobiales bacterium]MBO6698303.1 GTPase Era [Hyphomicrobiales bacterium]MBO6735443.1 GTPase Era [Hyphomicrobiales bacterium]MBO6910749.1 GTPase Era [Hyphomicrobiales bacterium]MBO6956758.1 GTPase Era [Hyphomicrobiales bacterium]